MRSIQGLMSQFREEEQACRIAAQGKDSCGTVRIRSWTKTGRITRAVKVVGACWLAAAVSIFIPVVHLILVPLFLLAGPLAAIFLYLQGTEVIGGHGICPSCSKQFDIIRAKAQWPLQDICKECNENVRIYPKKADLPAA